MRVSWFVENGAIVFNQKTPQKKERLWKREKLIWWLHNNWKKGHPNKSHCEEKGNHLVKESNDIKHAHESNVQLIVCKCFKISANKMCEK